MEAKLIFSMCTLRMFAAVCLCDIVFVCVRYGCVCLLSYAIHRYRFAEGDSSILRQKMARDLLKKLVRKGPIVGMLTELLKVSLG